MHLVKRHKKTHFISNSESDKAFCRKIQPKTKTLDSHAALCVIRYYFLRFETIMKCHNNLINLLNVVSGRKISSQKSCKTTNRPLNK